MAGVLHLIYSLKSSYHTTAPLFMYAIIWHISFDILKDTDRGNSNLPFPNGTIEEHSDATLLCFMTSLRRMKNVYLVILP